MPVRSFRHAKQRLSRVLDQERRRRLAEHLTGRSIEVVRSAGLEPIVVSSADDVAAAAQRWSVEVLPEPAGGGLDTAAGAAAAHAGHRAWLILHADLPLLTAEDLTPLLAAVGAGWVIAPSHDGGTTALGGRGEFHFSYGVASFHRHLRAAPTARVVSTAGLLLDVDDHRDLEAARRHPRGAWLEHVLQ